jgi:hypothetical protein
MNIIEKVSKLIFWHEMMENGMKTCVSSVKNMANGIKRTHLQRMPERHAVAFVSLDGSVQIERFQTPPCIPCIGAQAVTWIRVRVVT